MSKVAAPDIEPAAKEEPVSNEARVASSPKSAPAPVPRRMPSRGRHIDFTPRRPKVKKAAGPNPVIERHTTVVVVPPHQKPVNSGFIDMRSSSPRVIANPTEEGDSLVDFAGFDSVDTEDDLETTLANFAGDEIDAIPLEESQEDFLAEDDPEDYVEEVLSQVSESRRTETTVRRSPFLKNYHIEKRPLSSRVPVREQVASAEDITPTPREEYHEEEFIERADSVPENAEEPVVTKTEKTGSRIGAVITILITIILGAGVGVFVYLAFFQ